MEAILGQFHTFSIKTCAIFFVIVGCLIYSLIRRLKDTWNNPLWTIILSNAALILFVNDLPMEPGYSFKIIVGASIICIVWYVLVRQDEKQENEERGIIQDNKNFVTNTTNSLKSRARDTASQSVGGGLFGDLLGSFVDSQTSRLDGPLSNLLNFFGDSRPYYNKSRYALGTTRLLILSGMLIMIFCYT